MTKGALACGDLLAYRRYAYARSAADDGDWRAAAEALEQALERAPGWAPAWFALGEAREKLGDRDGAAEAFRAALDADPSDAQGAAARPALLGLRKDRQTPRRMAVSKATTAIPIRREAIHEQGERPW
ncbi:MAG: tetratricopeptide repeat protein [Roseiarcus sp.]